MKSNINSVWKLSIMKILKVMAWIIIIIVIM
jgi:hypothetical protein